jgi:hypothetical protein
MINTVPVNVELSEILRPLPAKPDSLKLTYHPPSNTITLSGEVRVRDWVPL